MLPVKILLLIVGIVDATGFIGLCFWKGEPFTYFVIIAVTAGMGFTGGVFESIIPSKLKSGALTLPMVIFNPKPSTCLISVPFTKFRPIYSRIFKHCMQFYLMKHVKQHFRCGMFSLVLDVSLFLDGPIF